ncbi:hypothetical protein M2322_000816 [Rhodoblastus acidophilus]|uniref:hypothetical protein n=1 Tax=Rhodoblastus acidophilus TaxID=1074 RepID=UPI00222403A0|nr:hypothetical protein [Rhodoblastus acidophilus]MCW2315282.1 hypothetical protein [Rhodoblastus acidophilus]
MTDLPWSPASGQTSLRVVEQSEGFVICEDKTQWGLRSMWRRDGVGPLAIGGDGLTLKPAIMKPESAPEPDPIEPPHEMVAAPPLPASAPTKRKAQPVRKTEPAQMSFF